MALPKEPRQKMINIMYLVLTAILALNVSAEILNAFKVVRSSLEKSNGAIDKSNATLFASLKSKMEDPANREKATIWNAKAEQAQKLTDQLFTKISGFQDSLMRASGYNPEKGLMTYKEDDLEAATHMFIVNGRGPELLKDLTNLKEQLLNLDPDIKKEFATKLPIDLETPKSTTGSENTWEYNYFHMTPTVAAITILSKFQNDINMCFIPSCWRTYCYWIIHPNIKYVHLISRSCYTTWRTNCVFNIFFQMIRRSIWFSIIDRYMYFLIASTGNIDFFLCYTIFIHRYNSSSNRNGWLCL